MANALRLDKDGNLRNQYGIALPLKNVEPGASTPTVTSVANLDSYTLVQSYMRQGNLCYVTGKWTITNSGALTSTIIMPVPILPSANFSGTSAAYGPTSRSDVLVTLTHLKSRNAEKNVILTAVTSAAVTNAEISYHYVYNCA